VTDLRGAPGSRYDDPEPSDAARPERSHAVRLAEARALLASAGVDRPRDRNWLGSRRRQVVAACIVLAAFGYVAFQFLTSAEQYFLTTKAAVAERAQLGTKPFRIEGTVEHDVRQVGRTIRFDIYADGVTVGVDSSGSPPQLFQPGIPVVLVGHWQGNVFASDQIMVKHSARYVAAHPGRLKSQLPSGAKG
jgi:cytochrome c-type biogenesis protein CcmE